MRKYRKNHASVRHEYYAMATQHASLDKSMFTFTVGGRGRGVYTKLGLINEIKSYVTYLIANSKSEICFFSVIEVGSELSNPHLHTQLWSNNEDAVRVIYDKVIAKFSLVKKRCTLSKPQQPHQIYNYVIKDYSKDLSDNEIWNLEQTKKRMRSHMGVKLRFISKSKGKYTQVMYKMAYRAFGVLRAFADDFLDLVTSCLFFKREIIEDILYSKKFVISTQVLLTKSSFITI
ncbi:MAG: hypothetical protein J7L21_04315, partial [Sulfurimonas sp.]|nr:hypothetical protein [Sulfurimonas sp.]